MDEHNSEFESYLRQFEPRRPRVLAHMQSAAFLRVRRLAAAAVLVLFIGGSMWMVRRNSRSTAGGDSTPQIGAQGQAVSVLPLMPVTQLALQNPTRLDAKLYEASRSMLPNFQKTHSTLQVLAKE
jgi:hypothetical protein